MFVRVFIVVLLASCASGFIVKVDSDESFSANKYKDFEIFKPDPFNTNEDEEENPIRINRVAKALSDSLTELGLNEKENSHRRKVTKIQKLNLVKAPTAPDTTDGLSGRQNTPRKIGSHLGNFQATKMILISA